MSSILGHFSKSKVGKVQSKKSTGAAKIPVRVESYQSPVAVEPKTTGAENALLAVDNQSREYRLIKFPDSTNYSSSDGRPNPEEGVTVRFWCSVQPSTRGQRNVEAETINTPSGSHIEGSVIVHYNPYHPAYLEYEGKPEPVYVHQAGAEDNITGDYYGFADLLYYDGEYWKVVTHNKYHVMDSTSDRAHKGVLCRAEFVRFKAAKAPPTVDDNGAIDEVIQYELGSSFEDDELYD